MEIGDEFLCEIIGERVVWAKVIDFFGYSDDPAGDQGIAITCNGDDDDTEYLDYREFRIVGEDNAKS